MAKMRLNSADSIPTIYFAAILHISILVYHLVHFIVRIRFTIYCKKFEILEKARFQIFVLCDLHFEQ